MRTKIKPSCNLGWITSGFFYCGDGLLIAVCLAAVSSPIAAQENAQPHSAQQQMPNSRGQKANASDPSTCVTKPESAAKNSSAAATAQSAEEPQERISRKNRGAVTDENLGPADASATDLASRDPFPASASKDHRLKI